MKKYKKIAKTNKDYCPCCGERWEDCICENIFNEDGLIHGDDQEIESGLGIY